MPTNHNPVVAASLLAADFGKLGAESQAIFAAGCSWLHIDIMDGRFVPQLTFGAAAVRAARQVAADAIIDVHLMVQNPEQIINEVAAAGADYISFHPDSTSQAWHCLEQIRSAGCKVGCALSPAIALESATSLISELDLLLIMTVEPGFGGQPLIEAMVPKVAQARELLSKLQVRPRLEVDGGVNASSIRALAEAGADTFVAGSAVFKGDDYAANVAGLLKVIND